MSTTLTIGPVAVERDEDGHWYHPGIPWDDVPEEVSPEPTFTAWGFESKATSLETDAHQDMVDRYFEGNSPDCSYWTPTPPTGEGWFLAAIYDTEDGPYAWFLRPTGGTQ